jgi:hypothetical protein
MTPQGAGCLELGEKIKLREENRSHRPQIARFGNRGKRLQRVCFFFSQECRSPMFSLFCKCIYWVFGAMKKE